MDLIAFFRSILYLSLFLIWSFLIDITLRVNLVSLHLFTTPSLFIASSVNRSHTGPLPLQPETGHGNISLQVLTPTIGLLQSGNAGQSAQTDHQ